MPFTGSHPAAVLPFVRWLTPSALVIGSMAPDIPLYVASPVTYPMTHSLSGVITIDLLLGLALFAAWQELLGPAVVLLAPPGLSRRLTRRAPAGLAYHSAQPGRIFSVLGGLALGALTHVGWDQFTHVGQWGERHIGWLAATHGPMPGWLWAQDASTAVGLLLLLAYGIGWWRTHPPVSSAVVVPVGLRVAGWSLLVGATLAGAAYGWLLHRTRPRSGPNGMFLAATHGVNAGLVVLVALALVLVVTERARSRQA